jgi:Aerobic-type carbon monoxide dehydrogenase, large subunit CoxL/CutL homologs
MNSPVGPNALDAEGVVGKPLDRVDGRLKVTGGARYAYEMQQNTLYGFVVEASIGKGKIKSIDTRAAEKAPGVVWSSPIATRPRKVPAITARRIRCLPARSDALRPAGCLCGRGKF